MDFFLVFIGACLLYGCSWLVGKYTKLQGLNKFLVALLVALVIWVSFMVLYYAVSPSPTLTKEEIAEKEKKEKAEAQPLPKVEIQVKIKKSEYEKNANEMDYRKAMFKEYKEGDLFKITGEVTQIIYDDTIRITTKKDEDSGIYIDNDIMVDFEESPRALEGDIIKVYARYKGTLKYETVLKAERKVPEFRGDYYEVIKTK